MSEDCQGCYIERLEAALRRLLATNAPEVLPFGAFETARDHKEFDEAFAAARAVLAGGGDHTAANLKVAHPICNIKKGAKIL